MITYLVVSLLILSGVIITSLLVSHQVLKNQVNTILQGNLQDFRNHFYDNQLKAQTQLHDSLSKLHHQTQERHENSMHRLKMQMIESLGDTQKHLKDSLAHTQQLLSKQFEKLNETTDARLHHIGDKVEQKLAQGFEKTSQTFTDIVKRLALIDDAQKKIHDLSSNVVSLQEILQDKRSRGAFGEIQLKHLLENTLPANAFALQHTLSNQNRVDSILFLPKPTGHIAIDAKFPLDNYRVFTDFALSADERKKAQQLFRIDIKKHIQDIASKYIIPGETSDGAIMFIPAEAVFAEIHGHFPDLVEIAHQSRVWITSPTTMMAILTTASAVLKDSATRQQVHIIQKHLKDLAVDFERFDKRMDQLAKHIQQANTDVEQINTSSKKISSRFAKIERVELTNLNEEVIQETLTEIESTEQAT